MIKYYLAIVIPNWNGETYLPQMLESIGAQTFDDYQVFIVDDQSVDGSLRVIEEYERRNDRIHHVVRNRLPKGGQTCRNIGFALSEGAKYVMFLDNDDMISPYCFKQRVEYMEANADLDMAVFPAITFEKTLFDIDPPMVFGIKVSNDTLHDMLERSLPLPMVGWTNIYKRQSYVDFALFWDENIPSLQDSDINIQSLIKGIKFKFAYDDYQNSILPDYFYRTASNRTTVAGHLNSPDKHRGYVYLINKIFSSMTCKQRNVYKKDLQSYVLFLCKLMYNGTMKVLWQMVNCSVAKENTIFHMKLVLWFLLFHKARILDWLFPRKIDNKNIILGWQRGCNFLINALKKKLNENIIHSTYVYNGGGNHLLHKYAQAA